MKVFQYSLLILIGLPFLGILLLKIFTVNFVLEPYTWEKIKSEENIIFSLKIAAIVTPIVIALELISRRKRNRKNNNDY